MPEQNRSNTDAAAENLLRAFFQFRGAFKPENIPHAPEHSFGDLRHSEVMLLFMLDRASLTAPEGVNASDLSRMLHVKPPSITPNLARLEQHGYICRSMDPADRRIVRVRLQPEGRSLINAHKRRLLSWIRGLVDHLGVEKSILFTELIDETFDYVREQFGKNGCAARRGK